MQNAVITHAVGVAVPAGEVRAVLPRMRTGGYLLATGPGGTALLPDPPRLRLGLRSGLWPGPWPEPAGERRVRRFARDLAVELAAPVWHLLDRAGGTRATVLTPEGAAAGLDWPAGAAARRADWERRCIRLATMAGHPGRGVALAGLCRAAAVADGPAAGAPLLGQLCELFGLPVQLVGHSPVSRAVAHGRGAVRFEGRR
ncbi:hypothetical protein OG500_26235 [Kitasatospora sp. NBC_01250]|uniref:hypothetical protein n=1 Tax=unclassified Kitasatospora TaxID=2633591 RepID=UPI002E125642|nr:MULTISPECIES: hypothetical protein [unclassified Kitasatospora]WSJ69633.1 hypothetical protein OG294_28020 [Kitasatospora sp. NBC_01302]